MMRCRPGIVRVRGGPGSATHHFAGAVLRRVRDTLAPAGRDIPSIPRELAQLWAGVRRAFDHGLPGHLVSAVEKCLRCCRPEVERLDAGGGLALALGLDVGFLLAVEAFEP